MEISITTTTKKITKAMIKQMELANWESIERQMKENPSTSFFKVNDVFKFDVVIFKGYNDEWYYFPLHTYTLSFDKQNAYMNGGSHIFIRNQNKSELFIENVDYIKSNMTKIFI
jgi:hypothetical protein